jgi:ribonuclease HI
MFEDQIKILNEIPRAPVMPPNKEPEAIRQKRKYNFIIYTDGGYDYNTHVGSWAYLIKVKCDKKRFKFYKKSGVIQFTNSSPIYSELQAAIEALKYIEMRSKSERANFVIESILVCTDNKQVSKSNVMNARYERNGWKHFSSSKYIEQYLVDAWKEIKELNDRLGAAYQWVKAHDGNINNELCDLICTTRIRQTKKEIYYNGFINDEMEAASIL